MSTSTLSIPYEQLADYCRSNQIDHLALFGSAVRGEMRADSDVDLLVEFAPEARMGRELSVLFKRPVDLVPRAGLKPLIREEALQSARVLYAV